MKNKGPRFRKTKLFLLIVIAISIVPLLFPNAFHIARYYAYEGYDWTIEKIGMAPQYDNLSLGAPEGRSVDRIFDREGYALGYSEQVEQPLWVTYKLTAEEVKNKTATRTDDFREDPRILSRSASPDDYKNSGYDRGHLAPAADMSWSKTALSESFYMSNMSPQVPEFNRGIWLELEELVRTYAVKEKEIFVVTGPIFYSNMKLRSIGRNVVVVPDAFYKVIFALTPPRKMIGFILPNARGTQP